MQSLQSTTDLRTILHRQRQERLQRINEAAARIRAGLPPLPREVTVKPAVKSAATNVKVEGAMIVVPAPKPARKIEPIHPRFVYSRAIGPIKPSADELVVIPDSSSMTARRILKEVCEAHELTPQEVLSDRRSAHLVKARHEAIWRVSRETTWSLPQIGKFFGGRDHTTCLNAIRKVCAAKGIPYEGRRPQ